MRHVLLPILERESGRRAGPDFGLCYSPEFIALGSVIADFLNPDFTLVGQFDDRSGAALESLYTRALNGDPPCRRMSLENAELTKVALNAYVTTKISFANMLADLCERLPGGDVDVVTDGDRHGLAHRAQVPARRPGLRRALFPARQPGARLYRRRARDAGRPAGDGRPRQPDPGR